MKTKHISVVGLGYVGLPLALLADKKGYKVIGIDTDQSKIDLIKNKKSPFVDEEIISDLAKSDMEVASDFSRISEVEIVIICVPTPVDENHFPDLEIVESATKSVAENMVPGQLIILESTVNPDVTEQVVLPILEKVSGLKAGVDFYLAHAPERVNPGDPKWNVENIDRVVGSLEEVGLEKAVVFYESIITGTVKQMNSLRETEAVKVVENSFRDINIAFVNELARSFTKLGIDVVHVIDGAATKPFSFLAHYPGCGVGGHCIPVDPYYLIEHAKKNGFTHHFLSLAREINNDMPNFTIERLETGLKEAGLDLDNCKVAVLGISYKADIGDYRESPSLKIIEILKEKNVTVNAYDPFVPQKSNVKNLAEALEGVDGVIIATPHKLFIDATPDILKSKTLKAVVDGRNSFKKEDFEKNGIVYKGIGR